MSKKMQFDREDYLKANRKLSREEEIKTHGRPVRIGGVHKSKKVYDRKRSKAEMKKALPYFLLVIQLAISASGIGRREGSGTISLSLKKK